MQREPREELRASVTPTATELYQMIAEAAYYRAEKRGFAPGLEAQDWQEAEAEVRARMCGPGSAIDS